MRRDIFISDDIGNAFDLELKKLLSKINVSDVPSNFTTFYSSNIDKKETADKKIKYNNKILHQSKLVNYFNGDYDLKDTEKELENVLKKVKKDKKYFFSIKDLIVLESLKSDGLEIPKKYENIYEKTDPNIPYDIQIFINRNACLKLVQQY